MGKKRQQKVALGDRAGTVQCIAVKKGLTETVFKGLPEKRMVRPGIDPPEPTPGAPPGDPRPPARPSPSSSSSSPSSSAGGGRGVPPLPRREGEALTRARPRTPRPCARAAQVSSITLGAGANQKDKIFACIEQSIKGYTKKGKEFFKLTTNLAENINFVQVDGNQIFITGKRTYNHAQIQGSEYNDICSYVAPDEINDALVLQGLGEDQAFSPVLGCQDRFVRVLSDAAVFYEASVDGPVSCLVNPQQQHLQTGNAQVIYGTETGAMGLMRLDAESMRKGWSVGRKRGGITSLNCALDLGKDGMPDILVGRDNGNMEYYAMDERGVPVLSYERNLGDAVSTVDGGYINSPAAEDIVVQTASGKVITFTSGSSLDGAYPAGEAAPSPGTKVRGSYEELTALRTELASLKKSADVARMRHSNYSNDIMLDAASGGDSVSGKWFLDTDDGSYVLKVTSQVPIHELALQTKVPLRFNPHDEDGDGNQVLLTVSRNEQKGTTSAAYRCHGPTKRLEVRVRVQEGASGNLTAFVIPQPPTTVSTCMNYVVKPLCLHSKILPQDIDEATPMNELRITGQFTIAQMHMWISTCMPEISVHAPVSQQEESLHFRNGHLGTVLEIRYRNAEGVFLSDNIMTLGTIRETIAQQATLQNIRVNIQLDLNDASPLRMCTLLHPLLKAQLALRRKVKLIDGLMELKYQGEDPGLFSREYQEIIEKAEDLKLQAHVQTTELETLVTITKELYAVWLKVNGETVSKARVKQLEELLETPAFSAEDLGAFITAM